MAFVGSLLHLCRVCIKSVLDAVFDPELPDDVEPDVQPLKELLLRLIHHGQMHDMHGYDKPKEGVHACARNSKRTGHTQKEAYCRYGFPRHLYPRTDAQKTKLGSLQEDPFRPDVRNLCLRRNNELLNNFEEHMLLANLGNIDWRALVNVWSVLQYLTKYA